MFRVVCTVAESSAVGFVDMVVELGSVGDGDLVAEWVVLCHGCDESIVGCGECTAG